MPDTIEPTKRPTSPARAAASRANGAKSRGPRTLAGKARSASSALSRSLRATGCLIPGESHQAFQTMLDNYLTRLQPRDQVEENLIHIMVHSCWRTARIWQVEKEVLATAQDKMSDDKTPTLTPAALAAQAFHGLADQSRVLPLIARFESAYERTFSRALRDLMKLRAISENFTPNPTTHSKQTNSSGSLPEPDQNQAI